MRGKLGIIKHEPSGLYLGPCRFEGGASIYRSKYAVEPIRICQTRVELAAYLQGWVDSKKYISDVHDVEEYYKDETDV